MPGPRRSLTGHEGPARLKRRVNFLDASWVAKLKTYGFYVRAVRGGS